MDYSEIKDFMNGKLPPWLLRFVKQTGRGINKYKMINDGDRVLLGISGGKDSLALALALALRKRWLPIDYHLEALQIDWKEYPIPASGKKLLHSFFTALEIPFRFEAVSMHPNSFSGRFNCYLCSRNRKRVLFDYMAENNFSLLALGHHLDDIVETTLINMCFRGNISTMMPRQNFFEGKISLIRPMCEVKESQIVQVTERLNLPVMKVDCPFKDTNLRLKLKPIIRQLSHIDRHTRENIYKSVFNINHNYLPSDLHDG